MSAFRYAISAVNERRNHGRFVSQVRRSLSIARNGYGHGECHFDVAFVQDRQCSISEDHGRIRYRPGSSAVDLDRVSRRKRCNYSVHARQRLRVRGHWFRGNGRYRSQYDLLSFCRLHPRPAVWPRFDPSYFERDRSTDFAPKERQRWLAHPPFFRQLGSSGGILATVIAYESGLAIFADAYTITQIPPNWATAGHLSELLAMHGSTGLDADTASEIALYHLGQAVLGETLTQGFSSGLWLLAEMGLFALIPAWIMGRRASA